MSNSSENWRSLKKERLLREGVRSSLTDWAALSLRAKGQTPALHHRRLMHELEALSRGELDRLIVLMPPGSAKSTYTSILYPAWWFTQHGSSSVLAVSHTADLAAHFSRQVRNLVGEHAARLGYGLAPDKRNATSWHNDKGGSYHSAGVRGPVVGRRADLIVIDDPIKSQAEADSAAQRDHVWSWYRSDLIPRLKPEGRIVVVMTRWHEDDLGGRLQQGNEGWRTLSLPAIAEADDPMGRSPGEALWPEWENAEALARKREAIGERAWFALFQQQPRPLASGVFRLEHLTLLDDEATIDGVTVRAWDLAATRPSTGRDPDWTVGLKMARTNDGRFVVLDVVRMRGGPHEVEEAIVETARRDGKDVTIGLPQDPGQAGRAQVLYLTRKLAGAHVVASPETGAKSTRAMPVASQCGTGNLLLLRAAWNAAFIEELRSFPTGSKDDQVDALSRAFGLLTAGQQSTRVVRLPLMAR